MIANEMVRKTVEDRPSGPTREARAIAIVAAVMGIILVALSLRSGEAPVKKIETTPYLFESEPFVRVQLLRPGAGPWKIGAGSALLIETPGTAGSQTRGRSLKIEAKDGTVVVDGRAEGKRIEVAAQDGSDITIGNFRYRGRLAVDASLQESPLVISVPLEAYMAQVLPGEMPLNYPREALKAQCIAGRTYAVAALLRRKNSSWDVRDDESSQVFNDMSVVNQRAVNIVAETSLIVMMWKKKIFTAYYSANCGGATRSNREAFNETEIDPLAGVVCGFCEWSDDFRWTYTSPVDTAQRDLELGTRIKNVRLGNSAASGYETGAIFQTSSGDVTVTGRKLKSTFGHHKVKSTKFTDIAIERGRLVIRGVGFGHGVGLCQNGCRGLANTGKSAQDILHYYYPGMTLEAIEWPKNAAKR